MKELTPELRKYFDSIKELTFANPFSNERILIEQKLLQKKISEKYYHAFSHDISTHIREIHKHLNDVLKTLKPYLSNEIKSWNSEDKERYCYAVWFWIYHLMIPKFEDYRKRCEQNPEFIPSAKELYNKYYENLQTYLLKDTDFDEPPLKMDDQTIADLIAFSFQLWRGFYEIRKRIVGRSQSTAQLRLETWEAIFTQRLFWSFGYLKDRMANFSTLILGPSGSGKDGVAAAIGYSQFIPFNPMTLKFEANPYSSYHAVNLMALSPTLIESELFGHAKGAFTGAETAKKGLLEECTPYCVLFLDEVGDLTIDIQTKLLRVMQNREFQALGDRKTRTFHGRIVSATNKDISHLVETGSLREDFLYRLGSIVIKVPPLAQRFVECQQEADDLRHVLLNRILGEVDEEIEQDIKHRIQPLLDQNYNWPGNIREYEQCIRSLLIKSSYQPLITKNDQPRSEIQKLCAKIRNTEITLDQLVQTYCHHAFNHEGSYQAAARKLNADWRTVKKYVEGD